MHRREDRWLVYDIFVDGVSLVRNYRAQFNTLVRTSSYAELLRRKIKDNDPSFRPIDIIYREAERMAEIVRKIGKITKYETKPYVGDAEILDLNRATSHED